MHVEEVAAATATGTGEEPASSIRTQSEGEDSDASSVSSCSKKKKYQVISQEVREQFIQKVISKQVTIKEAAREFGLKFSTSKAILQTYKKEGRIGKKKTRQRKPRSLKKGMIANVEQGNQNNLSTPAEATRASEEGAVGATVAHQLSSNPFQNLHNPSAVSNHQQHHPLIFQQAKDKLEGGINSELLQNNSMQLNQQIQQQQHQQAALPAHNSNTVFAHLGNLAAAAQLSGTNSTRHPSNPSNMLITQQSSNPFLTAMPFSQYPHGHQQNMSQNQPFSLQEQPSQQAQQQKHQSILESQYYNLKYNQQQQQQQLVQLQQQQQRLNQQQPVSASSQSTSQVLQSPMLGGELMNNYMLFGFPFSLDPSAQQQQMQQQQWQQQQQQQAQQGLSATNGNNNKNTTTSDVLHDVLSVQKTTYGFPLVSSTLNEQYQSANSQSFSQQGNNNNAAVGGQASTVASTEAAATTTAQESTQAQLQTNLSDPTIKRDLSQEEILNFNGSNHNTPTAALGSNQLISATTNLNSSLFLTKGTQGSSTNNNNNSSNEPQPPYPLQSANPGILPGSMNLHQQSILNEFNDSQLFSQFDTSNKRYTHSFPSSDPNSAGPSFTTQATPLGQSSTFPSVSFFGTPFLTPANPNSNNNNNNLTPQLYSHKLSQDSLHFNSIFGMQSQQQQQSQQPTPVAPNFGFPSIDMSQQYPFLFNSTPQIVSQAPQAMPSPLFSSIPFQKNTSL